MTSYDNLIHVAVDTGAIRALRFLVQAGLDIEEEREGRTPLVDAVLDSEIEYHGMIEVASCSLAIASCSAR